MPILAFIKDLIIATFGQMATLFGGIVVFGLLMHFISRLTFKSLEKSFGVKVTYLVAWLGTPIHELGHAIFCLIFAHRITDIKFFEPDPHTGTLGYVYHKWNPSNPWQVLGNFFIGIGPTISGSAALLAIFYFLIPNSSHVWNSITILANEVDQSNLIGSYFTILKNSAFLMLKIVFTNSNLTNWRFWGFLYVSICIASNIRLSPSDLKGALSGLGCIILPFLLINFLGLVSSFGSEKFLPLTASSLGTVFGLLVLAFIMALLGFVMTYLISATYVKIRRGYLLKPF
ncbi:hypothetical protein ACFLVW_05510 [Chloroflexota bacterium]